MPIPSLDKIEASDPVPDASEVVVVGGGIAGVTAALFLAEAGVQVSLFEKGQIAAEQSSRNWGWVRQMGRDAAEVPLAIESLALWRGIDRHFSIDTGFRETGITYVCRTPREIKEFSSWAETAAKSGVPTQIIEGSALARLLPGIHGSYRMALHTANDGRAEPGQAVPAMARAARRLGARIVENCAVRGIETSAGRVSSVVTERGTVRTSQVVLAGGVWSRLFLGNVGVDFPQLRILGTAARVDGVEGVPDMPVGGGDLAFRRRLDGGYTVALRNANVAPITPDSFRLFFDFLPTLVRSWRELKLRVGGQFVTELRMPRSWSLDQTTPFEEIRVLDPVPHEPFNRQSLIRLRQAFAAFETARITHSWAGMIDATPDAIPVIGAVEAVPGLFLSAGYSGHGFGIGPGAGRLMSEIVRGVTPCVDPTPFRLSRFGRAKLVVAGAAA